MNINRWHQFRGILIGLFYSDKLLPIVYFLPRGNKNRGISATPNEGEIFVLDVRKMILTLKSIQPAKAKIVSKSPDAQATVGAS